MRISTVVAVAASAVLATSCSTSRSGQHDSAPTASNNQPGQATASSGTTAKAATRVSDQKLGASYVVPQGFAEATGGPDIPGLLATVFVLGDANPPHTTKLVTQFMLTKLHGPNDYVKGTSPDMDNAALLDAFVQDQYGAPGNKPEGEPERSEWQGALPGASALVRTKNPITGQYTGQYEAFIGSGDSRWSVRGPITNLPPGGSIESVKAQLDAFAKSIQPL